MQVTLQQDEDLTRPYYLVNDRGVEIFRAATIAVCDRHAAWKGYILSYV